MHDKGGISSDERQPLSFCPARYVAKAIKREGRQKTSEAAQQHGVAEEVRRTVEVLLRE